jgi:hypothetical protein
MKNIAAQQIDCCCVGAAQARRRLGKRIEHFLKIER